MVSFTCNQCNSTLKKKAVENHLMRCGKTAGVSCIDCLDNFSKETYQQHYQCLTESEKFHGQFADKNSSSDPNSKQKIFQNLCQNYIKNNNCIRQDQHQYFFGPVIPIKKAKFMNWANNIKVKSTVAVNIFEYANSEMLKEKEKVESIKNLKRPLEKEFKENGQKSKKIKSDMVEVQNIIPIEAENGKLDTENNPEAELNNEKPCLTKRQRFKQLCLKFFRKKKNKSNSSVSAVFEDEKVPRKRSKFMNWANDVQVDTELAERIYEYASSRMSKTVSQENTELANSTDDCKAPVSMPVQREGNGCDAKEISDIRESAETAAVAECIGSENNAVVYKETNEEDPSIESKPKRLSLKHTPYRRIPDTIAVPQKFNDNSYEAKKAYGDAGYKSWVDLRKTQGKSFRQEKTKKKRSGFLGGRISTEVCSTKFNE